MRGLERLLSMAPPPAEPVDADAAWSLAEEALGLALPADFLRTARLYGSGVFCDDLYMCTPAGMAEENRELVDTWEPLREARPEDFPHPLHPEPGGLVIWGFDSIGGALCWLAEGAPDTWEAVYWHQRDGDFERSGTGAPGLLAQHLARREARAREEREDFDGAWFAPERELVHVCLRLTEGPLPYEERLRILRECLAPTTGRGGFRGWDGTRQDHFAATPSQWELTYETAYGHQLRVAHPPEEEQRVRTELLAAVRAMGCRVDAASLLEVGPCRPEFTDGAEGADGARRAVPGEGPAPRRTG